MKKLILAAFISAVFIKTAVAQQPFNAAEFNSHLGKTGTLCDTVYSLHIVSDTLTLLNMGAPYPNQKYTVAVKGNKINLDWTNLKGKPLCITGVFILYKGKPEIDVAEPERININEKH
jgi:hypothetical protein